MGLFNKKADPISSRSKTLSARIASLEAEIKKLDSALQQGGGNQPRVRSTSFPARQGPSPTRAVLPREPVFEPVDHRHLEAASENGTSVGHFNDLGVRKYDATAMWRRLRGCFRGPPASNPKLVTYLAAGSIRGLRPLRYEKRVARNRFIALSIILVCLLWGIISVLVRSQ